MVVAARAERGADSCRRVPQRSLRRVISGSGPSGSWSDVVHDGVNDGPHTDPESTRVLCTLAATINAGGAVRRTNSRACSIAKGCLSDAER